MVKVLLGGTLMLLSITVAGSALLASAPRPIVVAPLDTSGHEAPQDDAFYENGWNVANVGESGFKDRYLDMKAWLGEPIRGFDGQCQTFRFGRLCYDPAKPDGWKVELANAALEDIQVEGFTPKPGSTPHPALRAWKLDQLEAGADLTRLVGRTISDPVCDHKLHQCRQWTDKQLFLFPENAVSGEQVQRTPLGLWLTYPATRAAAEVPPEVIQQSSTLPAFVASAILALAGVAALASRRGMGSSVAI